MIRFELEVQSISEAREKIMELKGEFGSDIQVVVRFVSGNKDKLLNTLDDGAKNLFKQIGERMSEKCK